MGLIEEFRDKFQLPQMIIHETQHWIWSLRPQQTTVGCGVLSLKRECDKLSDLTVDEYKDLNGVIRVIEKALQDRFHYDVINYLMLMMVDKQVHFHVIPRYATERFIFDIIWRDKGWPKQPDLGCVHTGVNLSQLRDFIKEAVASHCPPTAEEERVRRKYRVGYTTGVYDMFHIGHLNILARAKELCEYLVVGVTTDELVSYKNKRVIIPHRERMKIVESVRYVDKVVPQVTMDKMAAWREHKFDVMFVGDDWKGTRTWNEYERQFAQVGVDIVYFPYTKGTSSSKLRDVLAKIAGGHEYARTR